MILVYHSDFLSGGKLCFQIELTSSEARHVQTLERMDNPSGKIEKKRATNRLRLATLKM